MSGQSLQRASGRTSTASHWFPGRLIELSPGECLELLAAGSVGRLGFVDPDGPVVLPVNYTTHEGRILFRTSPQSTLGRHLAGSAAAFEIDDFDEYTESGWSVLARGRTRFLTREELPGGVDIPHPWPEGNRSLIVRLDPHAISGRRLLAT